MAEVLEFSGGVSSAEKEAFTKVVASKVRSEIMFRMLSGEDMSQEGIKEELELLSISGQLTQSFSNDCLDILSDEITNIDPLTPESIRLLSSRVAAVFVNNIFKYSSGSDGLLKLLEDEGHSDLASDYRKTLYFSHDFSQIVLHLVRGELGKINQDEFFYFTEEGFRLVSELGETEEDIVSAIENMFFDRFGEVPFNIDNLLELKLQGFDYDNLQCAKGDVSKNNKPIRV